MADNYREHQQEYDENGQLRSHTEIKQDVTQKSPIQQMWEITILGLVGMIVCCVLTVVGIGAVSMITGAFFQQIRQGQQQ